MSRYLGPIYKKAKRLNLSLLETGQEFKHQKRRVKFRPRRRPSAFALQLNEKQKLRFRYFLGEQQLRNFFVKVRKLPGEKGENLLFNLERRLDNLVYRAGFAATRKAARQIVNHKQILINNKVVDIPSYLVPINSSITLKKPKFKQSERLANSLKNRNDYRFLKVDEKNHTFQLIRLPNRDDFKQDIELALIVEYYNRYL